MGLIDAATTTNAAKSTGIVTNCITLKPFGIRTYERGFNGMKTFDFNPCICHSYDDRACNPCISNTYEKHGEGGLQLLQNSAIRIVNCGKTSISGERLDSASSIRLMYTSRRFTETSQMKHILSTIAALALCAGIACGQQSSGAKAAQQKSNVKALLKESNVVKLEATPATVAWGHYDDASAPVLRVKSGDTVRVRTVLTSSPTRLERAGVAPDQVEQQLRELYMEGAVPDHGPGGHILTGPIYIEDAQPGDVLEIRIKSIQPAIPYAYNGFGPTSGFLPEDFPYAKTKIIPLDKTRMVAHFAPGIDIPLHPFFGSMGIAPPPAMGRISSVPPGIYGGNMDNKYMVAGTTLYLPVNVPGALFEVGDGHVGQGDGEVDITAMETSLIGTFQFVVRKDMHIDWPRAETPTEFITMGMNVDLNEATKQAVRQMIDFLVIEKHLTRDDAYMLSSVAADLHITELVDTNKGVHMMIPKSIFGSAKSAAAQKTAVPAKSSGGK